MRNSSAASMTINVWVLAAWHVQAIGGRSDVWVGGCGGYFMMEVEESALLRVRGVVRKRVPKLVV